MVIANGSHIQCMCTGCVLSGRTRAPHVNYQLNPDADRNVCKFAPWFESKLLEHSLVISDADHLCHSHFRPHDGFGPLTSNDCFDSDCHLIMLSCKDLSWYMFAFGARLWKAKSVNDPELKKLSTLISILESCDGED
jgi:hypothetical protein